MTGNGEGSEAGRPDRRVRRSQHALKHALLELVLEKGYGRVTVQDIIDRADVGRSTFYAHYRDKDDLFLSSLEDEVREAFGPRNAPAEDGSPASGSASLWLFAHTGEHADLYRALVRRRGGWSIARRRIEETLVEVFTTHLRDGSTRESVPIVAAAQFLASSLVGLLTWWLDDGMSMPPEEVDAIFRSLAGGGVESALGVAL